MTATTNSVMARAKKAPPPMTPSQAVEAAEAELRSALEEEVRMRVLFDADASLASAMAERLVLRERAERRLAAAREALEDEQARERLAAHAEVVKRYEAFAAAAADWPKEMRGIISRALELRRQLRALVEDSAVVVVGAAESYDAAMELEVAANPSSTLAERRIARPELDDARNLVAVRLAFEPDDDGLGDGWLVPWREPNWKSTDVDAWKISAARVLSLDEGKEGT